MAEKSDYYKADHSGRQSVDKLAEYSEMILAARMECWMAAKLVLKRENLTADQMEMLMVYNSALR